MLTLNPDERITAEEALSHPYFEVCRGNTAPLVSLVLFLFTMRPPQDYHDPEDEPVAPEPFSFECELDDLPQDQLESRHRVGGGPFPAGSGPMLTGLRACPRWQASFSRR